MWSDYHLLSISYLIYLIWLVFYIIQFNHLAYNVPKTRQSWDFPMMLWCWRRKPRPCQLYNANKFATGWKHFLMTTFQRAVQLKFFQNLNFLKLFVKNKNLLLLDKLRFSDDTLILTAKTKAMSTLQCKQICNWLETFPHDNFSTGCTVEILSELEFFETFCQE